MSDPIKTSGPVTEPGAPRKVDAITISLADESRLTGARRVLLINQENPTLNGVYERTRSNSKTWQRAGDVKKKARP